MRYLVLYEKSNGVLFYRYRKSKPQYEIGSYTSMGWKLLDVKKLSSGKVLSANDYSTLLDKRNRVVGYLRTLNYSRIAEFILFFALLKYYV